VIRVTADSNIYVSALQFGGKPQRLLELAIKGEIELAISPAILEELVTVFHDKFKGNCPQLMHRPSCKR
jgi:predicted nucleic acid-binding protein